MCIEQFVADREAPVITKISSQNPYTVSASNDDLCDLGIITTDNYESIENISFSDPISYVNRSIAGTYTITYFATDSSGNISNSLYRTVLVKDTSNPVILIEGSNPYTIGLSNNPYSDLNVIVNDVGDPNVSLIRNIEGVNVSTTGTYSVIYTATDSSGNLAETLYRTVVVMEDNTNPVITVHGDNPRTIEASNNVYDDHSVTVFDSIESDLVVTTDASNVIVSIVGTYTVIYTASDTAGNTDTQYRIVVVEDNTSPSITVLHNNPYTIEASTNEYIDLDIVFMMYPIPVSR